ncbi:MAG: SDR family NAD(P)-dependent oxidoreductase [Proteobacteria bacterium]|nr:SDR family NAD(P)-dependent oxidoreductase [Pseudomonadota bacterium]
MEVNGKLAIITGASRGIGRALSKELAKYGCNLILVALEETELLSLSDEIQRNSSVKVTTFATDLSKPMDQQNLINWIKRLEEYPDILINNAGIGGHFGRFEHSEWSNIEKTLALNIFAFTYLTYELIPILKNVLKQRLST